MKILHLPKSPLWLRTKRGLLPAATCFAVAAGAFAGNWGGLNVLPVAAATTFVRGDVDASGSVATNDMVLYAKFLSGMVNLQIDRADIDGNGVADAQDYAYLTAYNYGSALPSYTPLYGTWPVNSTVSDMTATNEGTREYYKQAYVSGIPSVTPSTYTLTVNMAAGGAVSSPNNDPTIGMNTPLPDGRTSYSNNAVVKVKCEDNGSMVHATGFIVGTNLVATAAHCVMDKSYGTPIWRNQVGIEVNGISYGASEVHLPTSYISNNSGDSEKTDYALIKVNTSVNLSTTYGKLTLAPFTDTLENMTTPASYTLNHLAAAGYSPVGASNNLHIAWGNLKNRVGATDLDTRVYTDVFIDNSDSGGPMIFDKDGNHSTTADRVVVAIITQKLDNPHAVNPNLSVYYRAGVRVTSQLLKFYYNNPNI